VRTWLLEQDWKQDEQIAADARGQLDSSSPGKGAAPSRPVSGL
jgi:hypothetical protein